MSFNVHRSERKTEYWSDQTPKVVAPGTYDPKDKTHCGCAMARGSTAPFNTVKERAVHDKVSDNPGPGFYQANFKVNENRVSSANQNNSFVTKVSRFAPSAPGSTVFKTATSFFNPGPGTYFKKVEWNKKPVLMETKEKYRKKTHKSMVIPPKAIPPSIPLKKVPPNSHSGRGTDRPGPANYNPNVDTVKSRKPVIDFAKSSKVKRTFESKTTEDPGPGMYDGYQEIGTKTSASFNASGCSPMFLSKVPNCKGTKDDNGIPGPGSYIGKKKKSVHQRSQSYRSDPNGYGFSTSTKREGYWDNNLDAPYTKGTNIIEGPGPAKYQGDKKKENRFDKINTMKAGKPGFYSTETRNCLKSDLKAQSPGPGQYIDMANPMFMSNSGIAKYSSERGIGNKPHTANRTHFGTTSTRFEGGMFMPKEGPGPGQYASERTSASTELTGILTKAQIEGRGKGGAVFKSTTDRFVENVPNNPNVRILNKRPDMGPDLMITNMRQNKAKSSNPIYTRAGSHHNRHVGFTATSPRFTHNQVFYGEKLKYTPGPGDYSFNNLRPSTYSQRRSKGQKQTSIFNSTEMKFCKGTSSHFGLVGTNTNIGPGSYDVNPPDAFIKKSYNHSM